MHPILEGVDAHAPAADRLQLRHAQIAPHPLNPRRVFDRQALQDLADDLVARGQLQNLVVRPAGVDGVHFIVGGERRWRAIGLAIEAGTWAADRMVDVKVQQVDDLQHLLTALAENEQRQQLNELDRCLAVQVLKQDHKLKNEEIAQHMGGKTVRWVQMRLKVLTLPEAELAKLAAGELTFKDAVALAQTSRLTPEERSARQTASLARANDRLHRDGEDAREADDDARTARIVALDVRPDATPQDLVELAGRVGLSFDERVVAGDREGAAEAARDFAALIWAANGRTHFGCERDDQAAGPQCRRAASPPAGEPPGWGGVGEFVVRAGGHMRAVARVSGRSGSGGSLGVEFWAIDRDRPFISETGFRARHLGDYSPGAPVPADAWGVTLEAYVEAGFAAIAGGADVQAIRPDAYEVPLAERFPWIAGVDLGDMDPTAADVERAARDAKRAADWDDRCVDAVAKAIKAKLARSRGKGRGGWPDCPPGELAHAMLDHVAKGDPVDVAAYAVFLANMGRSGRNDHEASLAMMRAGVARVVDEAPWRSGAPIAPIETPRGEALRQLGMAVHAVLAASGQRFVGAFFAEREGLVSTSQAPVADDLFPTLAHAYARAASHLVPAEEA